MFSILFLPFSFCSLATPSWILRLYITVLLRQVFWVFLLLFTFGANAQIDTPDKRQPYGNKAKQALTDMVFGKHIKAKIETVDRYGHYVADIYIDGKHVNAELIRVGAAWVYKEYVKDKKLFDIEEQARKDKVGLWGLPEADRMPPWEWR